MKFDKQNFLVLLSTKIKILEVLLFKVLLKGQTDQLPQMNFYFTLHDIVFLINYYYCFEQQLVPSYKFLFFLKFFLCDQDFSYFLYLYALFIIKFFPLAKAIFILAKPFSLMKTLKGTIVNPLFLTSL